MPDAEAVPDTPQRVECPAAKDPSVRRFIIAGMFIGMAIWCLTDQREYPSEWSVKNINDVSGYIFNNIGPYILFPIGVLAAIHGILMLRRRLVADESGIGYAGKEQIPWSAVTGLDTTKFNKGILRLIYAADGAERRFTLDEVKLQNFKALVQLIEAKVPDANSTD